MTKKRAASKGSMTVMETVPIDVRRLKLKKSPSLDYLDITKLATAAKAEFEVGHVVVDKVRKAVTAVVRKGQVIGLKMAECEGCADQAPSKELLGMFHDAIAQLDPEAGGPTKPMPVAAFLERPDIEISHCFLICVRWLHFCYICCSCCSVNATARAAGGCTPITPIGTPTAAA